MICCAESAPGVAAGPPASPAIFNLLQILLLSEKKKDKMLEKYIILSKLNKRGWHVGGAWT